MTYAPCRPSSGNVSKTGAQVISGTVGGFGCSLVGSELYCEHSRALTVLRAEGKVRALRLPCRWKVHMRKYVSDLQEQGVTPMAASKSLDLQLRELNSCRRCLVLDVYVALEQSQQVPEAPTKVPESRLV